MSDPVPPGGHSPAGGTATHCGIVVIGVLQPEWGEWFAGLEILPGEPCPGQTTLTGPIADQAELHGIITRVRDLGLPLVSTVVSDEVPPVAGRKHRRNEKDHQTRFDTVFPPTPESRESSNRMSIGGIGASTHDPPPDLTSGHVGPPPQRGHVLPYRRVSAAMIDSVADQS